MEVIFACQLLIKELQGMLQAKDDSVKKKVFLAHKLFDKDKIFEGFSKQEVETMVKKLTIVVQRILFKASKGVN